MDAASDSAVIIKFQADREMDRGGSVVWMRQDASSGERDAHPPRDTAALQTAARTVICAQDDELDDKMKSNLTKRRYKAPKSSACPLCKPNKRGRDDKKSYADIKSAMKHDHEIQEARRE